MVSPELAGPVIWMVKDGPIAPVKSSFPVVLALSVQAIMIRFLSVAPRLMKALVN
jgi:hypothetical protein